jgi:hypothetical protein
MNIKGLLFYLCLKATIGYKSANGLAGFHLLYALYPLASNAGDAEASF